MLSALLGLSVLPSLLAILSALLGLSVLPSLLAILTGCGRPSNAMVISLKALKRTVGAGTTSSNDYNVLYFSKLKKKVEININ